MLGLGLEAVTLTGGPVERILHRLLNRIREHSREHRELRSTHHRGCRDRHRSIRALRAETTRWHVTHAVESCYSLKHAHLAHLDRQPQSFVVPEDVELKIATPHCPHWADLPGGVQHPD